MDKRILKALKVLVFNPVLLEAQHTLEQVELAIEEDKGQVLTAEMAHVVKNLLGSGARIKSAMRMVSDAMDACDEGLSE